MINATIGMVNKVARQQRGRQILRTEHFHSPAKSWTHKYNWFGRSAPMRFRGSNRRAAVADAWLIVTTTSQRRQRNSPLACFDTVSRKQFATPADRKLGRSDGAGSLQFRQLRRGETQPGAVDLGVVLADRRARSC